ncbi:MAG: trypsin-like peptidase domain-containing protein [Gammaproteobacteria bacterium]|nr:trypsin-like peptidase domain-containing protein [Gammaproteobacteria bacterium]
MRFTFENCFARVWKKSGDIAGVAFLVKKNHLLTCAHVVNLVFGQDETSMGKPSEMFEVDFPFLADNTRTNVKVCTDLWYPRLTTYPPKSDIAVLEVISDLPETCCPNDLMEITGKLEGHAIRSFGFPKGTGNLGRWLQGEIVGPMPNQWLQAQARTELTGEQIRQGFSGAPVWSDSLGGIIGMIVGYDLDPAKREGFFIPTHILLQVLRDVKDLRNDEPPPWYTPYLVNYPKQKKQFRELIKDHRAGDSQTRNRPLVCLLHGREGSATTNGLTYRLKKDLEEYCLPEFEPYGHNATAVKEPYYFDCGERPQAGKTLRSALECSLTNKLKVKSLDSIRDRPFDGPVLFYTGIKSGSLSKELLQDFLAFWQEEAWGDQNHLFLVCLFVHYPRNSWFSVWQKFFPPGWLKNLAPDDCLLPELQPISLSAVEDWADSKEAARYLDRGKIQKLRNGIGSIFPNGKEQPMELLAPKLDKLLANL